MAKPIATLFKDAVAKTEGRDSDHNSVTLRDSDLQGLPEVIGVKIGSEGSDLFPYVDSLD